MRRLVLANTCLLAALGCLPPDPLAQERPAKAGPRQAHGIDIETHVDLLIGAEEAHKHVNQLVMVCGQIADAYFERSDMSYSEPGFFAGQRNTYLYFDKPRGEHDFVAIIRGAVRKDLPTRPESLSGHHACVFGKVSMFRQRAAIQVVRAEQIAAREPPAEAPEEAPD
jgi:hypothetical protein